MSGRFDKVAAVVVTYRYPQPALEQLLADLRPQVGTLIVVDNNPQPLSLPPQANQQQLSNRANRGLAAGLNQGIDAGLRAGAERLLLLDQDSRPGPAMLAQLNAALDRLCQQGLRPAAVGPQLIDQGLGALGFIRYGPLGPRRHRPPADSTPLACDMLLSSGTLIVAEALRQVGGMDAGLFVYGVDTDWCFRARAAGYSLYGIPAARLTHRLGQRQLPLPLCNRSLAIHSPRRHYYMARNYVRLMRRRYVPLSWKLSYLPRLLGRWLLFSVAVAPRGQYFRQIGQGLWHGLRNPTQLNCRGQKTKKTKKMKLLPKNLKNRR